MSSAPRSSTRSSVLGTTRRKPGRLPQAGQVRQGQGGSSASARRSERVSRALLVWFACPRCQYHPAGGVDTYLIGNEFVLKLRGGGWARERAKRSGKAHPPPKLRMLYSCLPNSHEIYTIKFGYLFFDALRTHFSSASVPVPRSASELSYAYGSLRRACGARV